jgi:hypothetical protein
MKSDLPMSTEMLAMMQSALYDTDEDGLVRDSVGSHLSQPLTVESLFFPTASLIKSRFSAARSTQPSTLFQTASSSSKTNEGSFTNILPPFNFTSNSQRSLLTNSTTSAHNPNKQPSSLQESNPALDSLNSRLRVLWLRRKAELERQEGNHDTAVQSLQLALNEHLGDGITANNYEQARLSQPALSADPNELLATITHDFFMYEPSVHTFADKIQRWYRTKYRRRANIVKLLTRCVRGFLVRNRMRKRNQLRQHCAQLLQRRFRTHLARMHRLATLVKRWYLLRRDMRTFWRRLFQYQMARCIQKFVRGVFGRRRAKHQGLRIKAVVTIQRLIRKFLFRNNRVFIISRIHRLFFYAARKIQRFIRHVQAIERCRAKLLLELLRENLRSQKEQIVVRELLRIERMKFHFYLRTKFGELQKEWYSHRIACKEDVMLIRQRLEAEEKAEQQKKESTANKISSGSSKKNANSTEKIESTTSSGQNKSGKKGKKSGKGKSTGKTESSKASNKVGAENQLDSAVAIPKQVVDPIIPSSSSSSRLAAAGESFVTPEVISIIDMFDEFEDGRVIITSLPSILRRLRVTYDEELLDNLHSVLDPQDSGMFNLSDLLRWFESEDADRHVLVHTVWFPVLAKFRLSYHSWRKQQKSKEKLLREEMMTKFFSKYYLSTFRQQNPSKFQCCQCLQAYPLFSDYWAHFDENLCCPVNSLRAIYYPCYWQNNDNWRRQREIELEICRVNDEFAFVRFWSRFQCFEELKSWSGKEVTAPMTFLRVRCNLFFHAQLKDLSQQDFCQKYIDILLSYLFPTGSVNQLNEFLLRMIAKLLSLPVQKDWFVEEGISLEETRTWLTSNLPMMFENIFEKPKVKDNGKKKKKNDESISDLGSNKNAFKKQKKNQKMKNRSSNSKPEDILAVYIEDVDYFNRSSPVFTSTRLAKYNEVVDILSSVVIRSMRLRLAESEAATIALLEFRGSRPRR